jgi:sugar phosphate isomerase/epimerase
MNNFNLDIGLSNSIFGKRKPREDDFRILNEAGIRQVEIRLKPEWLDINDGSLISETVGWFEKYQINLNSVHGPCGLPGQSPLYGSSGSEDWLSNPDGEKRLNAVEIRKKYIDMAKAMGAVYIIIEYECYNCWPYWPHGSTPRIVYPRSKELWIQSMHDLVDYALRKGIKLAIENIDGLSCAELIDALKDWPSDVVGICFDSSHATYGPEAFFESLGILLPRMSTMHLSDNDALRGGQWIDRHWTPFKGAIDWDKLISSIIVSGYRGCIMLEVLNDEKTLTWELMDSISIIKKIVQNNIIF